MFFTDGLPFVIAFYFGAVGVVVILSLSGVSCLFMFSRLVIKLLEYIISWRFIMNSKVRAQVATGIKLQCYVKFVD